MTHLRVVVDATAIPARLTGAGVYTARVLAELARRDDLEVGPSAPRGRLRPWSRPSPSWTDPAARQDAAARGLARAASFTWERCAELTAAAYSRALDDPARASSARPRGDSR